MSLPYHKPPPYERENWDGMNEGQRRYAMEQYNLALVRRGAKFTPPQSDTESEGEDFDIDQFVNDRYNSLGTPNQDLTPSRETSSESLPNSQESAAPSNFINELRNKQMDTSNNANINSQSSQGSVASAVTGKRRGTTANQGTAKKAKASTSGSALPGTSGNTDGMIGGGSNDGESSQRIEPIHRGITSHTQTFTFSKRWKFLTFGIADQILEETSRWALTSSLAAVPWEYAFFYMSPAEFKRMQDYRGVFAKHCSVQITQYNPRVAFQTADTTSTTATLNQNKFTRWAIGIRSNGGIYCTDRDYVFDATEPMKPNGFDTTTPVASRAKLVDAMYGVANTSPLATQNLNIPAYATGQELELQNYLTVYTPKDGDSGFPPYDQYCHEVNSMDYLGQQIVDEEYTFEYAPLQRKHDTIFQSLGETSAYDVMCGTKFEGGWTKDLPVSRNTTLTMENNADWKYTEANPATNVDNSNFAMNRPYFRFPMEQSGTYIELSRKPMDYANQKSIHIGVRAVPKLSTNANLIQTDSWLDTQIYFSVQATLTVVAHDSYFYIRGGPTIMPSQQMVATCIKEGTVVTPILQTGDKLYVCGRRDAVKNTTND